MGFILKHLGHDLTNCQWDALLRVCFWWILSKFRRTKNPDSHQIINILIWITQLSTYEEWDPGSLVTQTPVLVQGWPLASMHQSSLASFIHLGLPPVSPWTLPVSAVVCFVLLFMYSLKLQVDLCGWNGWCGEKGVCCHLVDDHYAYIYPTTFIQCQNSWRTQKEGSGKITKLLIHLSSWRLFIFSAQVLYVPRHWWHYVESVDPVTVSVNSWIELVSNPAMPPLHPEFFSSKLDIMKTWSIYARQILAFWE